MTAVDPVTSEPVAVTNTVIVDADPVEVSSRRHHGRFTPWMGTVVLRVPRWLRESAVVTVTVVVLQVTVFLKYYTGAMVPQWDFQSHYTTEAFAWWRDGSFFSPVNWLPYLWGGYPGVADLQNSSWYLPVGLVSALTPYDQHAAAVLSALHVAFGSIGVYLLARSWRLRSLAGLAGLVLWHFSAGFFANASHLDIMRGYAWIPWILLCTSSRWPWKKPWAPLVAVVVLWQSILGMYPGTLVATGYLVVVWVVWQQVASRPALRAYLVPLAGAAVLAVLLSTLRYVPALLTRGTGIEATGDETVASPWLLGTLWYSYGDASIPNDITMRSLFLPAPALVAALFASRKHPLTGPAAAVGGIAFLIAAPGTPWGRLVSILPGLDISRFRMSDFKPYLLIAITILAMVGIHRVLDLRPKTGHDPDLTDGRNPLSALRAAALVALGLVAVLLGVAGPFPTTNWISQFSLMTAAAIALGLACSELHPHQRDVLVGSVVLAALASGLIWAYDVQVTWAAPRAGTETGAFGRPVDDLIASRAPQTASTQRPARSHSIALSTSPTLADVFLSQGGSAFYSGKLGFDGYANLKGAQTFESILASIQDPATRQDAWQFWLAPGIVTSTDGTALPPARTSRACADSGACGVVTTEPVSYDPSPSLVYRVAVQRQTDLSLNEAYYPGWNVTLCRDATCTDATAERGDGGQLVVPGVPSGDWRLTATYRPPGQGLAWTLFWAASALTLVWVLTLALWPLRRRIAVPARSREGGGDR